MNHTNVSRFHFNLFNVFLALSLILALTLPIPTRSYAAPETIPGAASLPQEANAPISAAIGADQPSYHATADRDGFHMDNAQGLSAHFSSSGVDVYAGEHTWGMSLTSYGYGEAFQPVVSSGPTAHNNRIEYSRGDLTEWYVNGPFGLEQGFTLAVPPTGRSGGPLTLALSMSGDLNAAVDKGGKGLSLSVSDGTALLRYTGLMAYDANGRELAAWLEIQIDNQSNSTLLFIRVNDSGARYPLTIDPFFQKARLTASDMTAGAYFGGSVSISGDVVVVGAPFADPGGTNGAGAAYVFVKQGDGWADMTQTARLTASDKAVGDRFGVSVSISEESTIVVGAPRAHPGGTTDAGAVYIFNSNMWQTAKLTASDKAVDDNFGSSVSISGHVVVVGARSADPGGMVDAGATYVFVEPGGGWFGNLTQTAKMTASDKAVWDNFGTSVSISGDIVVVGARYADPGGTGAAGAAYVFTKPGGGWVDMTQTAKLTASDKVVDDYFGSSVLINGDVVVVGAPWADPSGISNAGSAYVFVKPVGGWVDMTQTARLTASDKAAGDLFGWSVSISGDVVVVGARYADPGGTGDAGAAYIFVKPGGGWADMTQTTRLAASDKAPNDEFGFSVSISGDVVVVGARYADPGGINAAGAAYVFVNCDSTTTTITADSPDPSLAGETVNVSVTVSGGSTTPSGTVDIDGWNTYCIISLTSGSGNCNVTFNTGGVNTLTATYNGDATHGGSSDTETHAVEANTTMTITSDAPDPSVDGQNVTVNFMVTVNSPGSGTPTGTVTVSDGVDSCSASVAAGSCTLALNTLGTRILTATYPGDTYFYSSSDTENHKVKPHTTTTIVNDNPDPSLAGGTVNVSVTVSGGSTTPSGTVDITGATTNCSISLSGGSGNCNVTFNTVGAKTLTATYNGDATHGGSSDTEDHTVKANTTTTITSDAPDPSLDGQNVTVNFTVTVNSPGSGTPTGTVTVSDGVDSCSASVAAGSCTLALNTPGIRILTATYPGHTYFKGSSDTEIHKVKIHTTTTIVHDNPDPSIINQAVTVNITVTGGTTAITGNVPITGADVNCVVTLSAGSGSCNVIFIKAGAKILTATYNGDATHGGSSDSEAHTVKANTHTTIVADTPDPSAINQVVTVGVTVTGGPSTPTGTVSISGADVNCVVTLSAGSGTCNVKFTSGGAKILMATYNGNATHAGSSDTEGHQVILRPSQFYSAGTYDGYILESTETSSVGGSANASETTIRLGDDASDRQYRSILSFNTASLPDNAVITSIVLKIKKQGLVGTDPFTTHQGLKVDIRKPYFGTEIGLAASDFQATAGKSSVGTFSTTPSAGWYTVTMNSTAYPYINTTSTTQFRLRFQLDDDNDNVADYIKFFSGDNAIISYRPLLIIQYYLP
jgi:hypothetical protein